MTETRRVAVEPKSGRHESLEAAVRAGGGIVSPIGEAEALVWADPARPHELPSVLAQGPDVRWVALPFAGIEPYVPYLDHDHAWTCAKGVYALPVAEHVLMLGLAGLRGLATFARATSWSAPEGVNLVGGRVVIFGGGGITTELVRLLQPFDAHITVIRRSPEPLPGVDAVVTLDQRLDVIPGADLVVLALALTDETRGVIGPAELAAMSSHAWLVNVARGGHVQTEALLEVLRAGEIGGAALDVFDPEPLPDGHPLWAEPRVLITPHVGNTPEMGVPLLAAHIEENVRRFGAGEALLGGVDPGLGY